MALQVGSTADLRRGLTTANWRRGLPVLADDTVTIRELTARDAVSLVAHLGTAAVKRHMAPPPPSVETFQRFIRWTHQQRRCGSLACFAIVPKGTRDAVGLVQVWRIESDFATAEWGIAVSEAWWGRGIARSAARLLFRFAFDTLQANRLEARTVAGNERGRRLMARLGSLREGTLRQSFNHDGVREDQELWAVFAADYAA